MGERMHTTREILLLEFSSSIMCLILAGKVGSNIASELGSAWNVTKNPGGEAVTMKSANAFDMPAAGVTIAPTFVAAVAPTISVNATSLSTPQNVSVELTATATGSPNPTVTWYQSATAVASVVVQKKQLARAITPLFTTIGTYYFYAVASNGVDPDAVSDVITFTVAPKLNSLVYSNGFKAFIQQPVAENGKISWVKAGNSFSTGWKIARSYESDSEKKVYDFNGFKSPIPLPCSKHFIDYYAKWNRT